MLPVHQTPVAYMTISVANIIKMNILSFLWVTINFLSVCVGR